MKYLKWPDASPEMRAQHVMKVYSNGQGWTTELPTQTGLYRAIAEDNGLAYWVELSDLADIGVFSVRYFGNDVDYSVSDFAHWLGPLPVPEPPA
jgi:hypothetical protein